MQANVKAANAQSIGLTIYPPYPTGYFKNSWLSAYYYQNGGDWTWFGGTHDPTIDRQRFLPRSLTRPFHPCIDRVIANNGFFEWYTPEGKPNSGNFKGSAGVLWKAIQQFNQAAAIN